MLTDENIFVLYANVRNENAGLVDKAGTSNRGGISLGERLRGKRIKRKYFDKCGSNCVFRKHVEIAKTDGAYIEMGDSCTLDKGATFLLTKPHPKLLIGSNVTIGRGTIISIKSTCKIGSYTLIGPNVQIQDSNHSTSRNNLIKFQRAEIKPINIGCDCWIGAGAKVLSGVTIGNGAVIGANAVVTKDIPDFAIAVGCPARVIKFRSDSSND